MDSNLPWQQNLAQYNIMDTEIDRVIGKIPMDEVDKALKHTLAL